MRNASFREQCQYSGGGGGGGIRDKVAYGRPGRA